MFFSTRHFSPLFTLLLLAVLAPMPVSADPIVSTYWSPSTTGSGARYSDPTTACRAVYPNPDTQANTASSLMADGNAMCLWGCLTGWCHSGKIIYKFTETTCGEGQYLDFDTMQCKWPQDDVCSTVGASWDQSANSCKCNTGSILVTAGGVSRCMASSDDSCSPSDPDFKGYGPTGQPVCDGSARCPDGGQPGYVGSGDQMSFVCIPPPGDGEGDDDCNGTRGIVDGVSVCIPKPGTDPDLPDCKGVVGKVNGQKVCIEPADNDSRCKPGEISGYVGTGDEMRHICIPKDYGPETCPPGQYIINMESGGFGCVTASGDNPGEEPTKNAAGKTPGKVTGNSTTEKKDGDGNTTESSTSAFDFQIEGLFHDAPENTFKGELDEFGTSALDSTIDVDGVVSEFGGSDGAFTQRNSLDNASAFIKTHTVGNSANCSGALNFLGYNVSCDKFTMYNRIIGWMIFVLTAINIYNTLMRKSDSGV